jgi:hypothetical protein
MVFLLEALLLAVIFNIYLDPEYRDFDDTK